MLPLMEMFARSGNGAAMEAMARQFALTPEQVEQAAAALMPAFSQGLRRNVSDPSGFMGFMNAMARGGHQRYFENPFEALSKGGVEEGNAILGHLFGSKEVSRAVAAQAAQMTGLTQTVLKQMLPALAPILLGGLYKQMTAGAGAGAAGANPLGDMLEQMMGGGAGTRRGEAPGDAPQAGNPWAEMMEQMMGGGAGARRGQVPGDAPQAGNPWAEMMEQMMGGGRAGGRDMPTPGADNPLGQIFQDMLRGGSGGMARPAQEEEANRRKAPEGGEPSGREARGLEDLFGEMFDTGRTMQRDYQKGIEQIFDQFLGGKNRG